MVSRPPACCGTESSKTMAQSVALNQTSHRPTSHLRSNLPPYALYNRTTNILVQTQEGYRCNMYAEYKQLATLLSQPFSHRNICICCRHAIKHNSRTTITDPSLMHTVQGFPARGNDYESGARYLERRKAASSTPTKHTAKRQHKN